MKAGERTLSPDTAARRTVAGLGALAAAIAALLAIFVAPAAALEHHYTISFKGSGADELETPVSADVDDTAAGASKNDVYVADSSKQLVEKFSPGGTFISSFGSGEVTNPKFIAVDSSSSASSGDVYVTNGNTVRKYTEGGTLVTGWGTSGVLSGGGTCGSFSIGGIDVDSTGHLDVWDVNGTRVCQYAQDGSFVTTVSACRGNEATGFAVAPNDTTFYKVNGFPSLQRFTTTPGQCVEVGNESGITGMNVDSEGTVYAVVNTVIHEYQFDGTGQPLKEDGTPCTTTLGEFSGCAATLTYGSGVLTGARGVGVARDKTLYVADTANHEIDVFKATPVPQAETLDPTGNDEVHGNADPNGVGPITECYFEYGETTAYGSKKNCEQSVPFNTVQPVSAHLTGLFGETTYHYRLVLANGEPGIVGRGKDKTITPHNVKALATEPATEITQESAVLNGKFEGNGEKTYYYFEWGQTTSYGHKTATPPGDYAGEPTGVTTISTPLTGLDEGTTYHYRVIAENGLGISPGKDRSFTTHEAPSIDSATTSHLTATSADVDLTINPHEFETEYFIEYGPSIEYGSIAPVPNGVIPPATTSQPATVHLTGLEGVLYHFRVKAKNEWGEVVSEDQSFNFYPQDCPNSQVRQQNESQYLPDCRAFELVTPAETGNIELGNAPSTPDPFATSPPRFAFTGGLGGLKGTEPINAFNADTYIATRTVNGWKSGYVGVTGSEAQANGPVLANPDFTRFFNFREPGGFEGEPQPPHRVPYIFDVENNLLERWPANFESIAGAEESVGAYQPSPDLTHMAITSNNVEFAPGGDTSGVGSAYDYNAVTGEMALISLDEEGNPIQREPGETAHAPLGIFFPDTGTREWNTGGYINFNICCNEPDGEKPDGVDPPVSDDGTHVLMETAGGPFGYFTNPRPPGRLYMSVDRGDHYDHYDVSQMKDVTYVGMTRDGSEVFFTSTQKLTGEDEDTSVDLYVWKEATNELTLVSKGDPLAEGSGNGDSCNATFVAKCGIVPVYSTGYGSYSDDSITENGEIYFFSPEQLDATHGVPNRENLFLYRGGKLQFVGSFDPTVENYEHSGPVSRIQVSPEGDHMALITKTRLTGYNNAGKEEMYTYNAVTRKIVCVSCRPDGKPPLFNVEGSKAGRFMTDDGRAFFSTEDPLLPTDTNEALDVYEFTEGRPQLITTGSGTTESGAGSYGGGAVPEGVGLSGVSRDGVNVYFGTLDVLVPQNKNGPFLAFYDARSGGGFSYVPPLAPCEAADECHGAGNAPPAQPGVASEGDLGDRGNAPNPSSAHKKAKRHKRHKRHHKRRHHARHLRQGGN